MASPYWLPKFDTSTYSQDPSSQQANAASASFQANTIHPPGRTAFQPSTNTAGHPWQLAAANNSFRPAANFGVGANGSVPTSYDSRPANNAFIPAANLGFAANGVVPTFHDSWPHQTVDFTRQSQSSDQYEQYFAARFPGVTNPSLAYINDDSAALSQLPIHSDGGLPYGPASQSRFMMSLGDNAQPAGFASATSAANYVAHGPSAAVDEQELQLAQIGGFFKKTRRRKACPPVLSDIAERRDNDAATNRAASKQQQLSAEPADDDLAKEIDANRKAVLKQITKEIRQQVFVLPETVSIPDPSPSNLKKTKKLRCTKLLPEHDLAETGQLEGSSGSFSWFLAKVELAKQYHAERIRMGYNEPEMLECYLIRDERDTSGPPSVANAVQPARKQNREALHGAVFAIVPSLLKAIKPPKEHLESLFSGSDIATKSLLCLAIAQTFDVPSLQHQADTFIVQHYTECAQWYNGKGVRAYLQRILDVLAGDGRYVFCALAKAGIKIANKVDRPTGNAAENAKFEFCYKTKNTADGIVGELLAEEAVEDHEQIKLLTAMCYIALPNWIFSLLRVISNNQNLRAHLLQYEQGIIDLVRCKRIFLSIMQYIENGDRIPDHIIHFMRNFFKKPDLSMDRKLLAYRLALLICYAPWHFLVPDWCPPLGVFSFSTADGKRFNFLNLGTTLEPWKGSLHHMVVIGEQFGKADPDTRCRVLDFKTADTALREILQADARVEFYINGTPDALETLYAPISQACVDLRKEWSDSPQKWILPDYCFFKSPHQELLFEDLRQPTQCSLRGCAVSPFRGVDLNLYTTSDVFDMTLM